MESKHTALPWHIGHIGNGEFRRTVIFDENHGQVAEVLEPADAAFIEQACNSHDALLAAAKKALLLLDNPAHTQWREWIEELRAAIAAAEGRARG